MSDTTSDGLVERQDFPLVERLEDAAMVLATARLRIGAEAGNALATDCAEGAAEIRRLEEAVKRWKHEEETIWVPLDKKATRYREALAVIRYKTNAEANFRDRVGIDRLTPEDACLAEINDIATQALEADHE